MKQQEACNSYVSKEISGTACARNLTFKKEMTSWFSQLGRFSGMHCMVSVLKEETEHKPVVDQVYLCTLLCWKNVFTTFTSL
jgi:hypothetical protein